MNGRPRPYVNLSSHPLRNRRLYFGAFSVLAVLFFLAVGLLGFWLLRASGRASADAKAVLDAEARLSATETERADIVRRTEALRAGNLNLVSQVNAVIARKNFSYVEFFALLEEALPAQSYITSVSPIAAGEGRIDARLRVVTTGLEDLMGLMTKLEGLKFKNVTIRGEAQVGGQLIAEIGLVYEKIR